MRQRSLGRSGIPVSEIAFGCMSLAPDRPQDSIDLIHRAIDRGVTLFDTADLYDQGRNEEILGMALKSRRSHVTIATKVGNRWEPGVPGWRFEPTKPYILAAVKESLRRLQTDYIDLYQLHGGTIDDPIDDIIEAFEILQAEGVIRAYGISSIRPNVIREYARRSRIQSVMSQYSVLDRRPEESVLPLLTEAGISLLARGALAQGLLSERYERKLNDKGYLAHTREEVQKAASCLQSLANDGRTVTNLAIRYALAHETVAAVVVGARDFSQLDDAIAAGASPVLTATETATLRDCSRIITYVLHR